MEGARAVSQPSMFSLEEAPARTGPWLDAVRDWLDPEQVSSSTSSHSLILSLPVGSSSRTSLVFCQPAPAAAVQHRQALTKTTKKRSPTRSSPSTGDGTSPSSSQRSPGSTPPSPREAGGRSGSAAGRSEQPLGVCMTASGTAWPSAGKECISSLSEILWTGPVPPKFYLSSRACRGILLRAERRGRTLPAMLKEALEQMASRMSSSHSPEVSEEEDLTTIEPRGASTSPR